MPFAGEVAALATSFCWATSSVLFTRAGARVGSHAVNLGRIAFALAFLLVLHLAVEGAALPPPATLPQLAWLAVSAIFGLIVADSLIYRAYVLIGPRLSTLMTSTVPVIGAVLAWMIFGETLSAAKAAGIACGTAGVALVVLATKKGALGGGPAAAGYRLGLLCGFGGALGHVAHLMAVKHVLAEGYGSVSATLLRTAIAFALMWGLELLRGRAAGIVGRLRSEGVLPVMLLGSLVGPCIGIWLSILSVQLTTFGVAATLMALPPILLIPYERVAMGRPVGWVSVLGTLVAFGGVALIFS